MRRALLAVYSAALSPYFDVATASSVQEAESILRRRKFKVVVSDHLMPGGNGMSFLVRTREEHPEMQRVLVTAYMKPEMLLRSVNEAALFRYLLKPISMGELLRWCRTRPSCMMPRSGRRVRDPGGSGPGRLPFQRADLEAVPVCGQSCSSVGRGEPPAGGAALPLMMSGSCSSFARK